MWFICNCCIVNTGYKFSGIVRCMLCNMCRSLVAILSFDHSLTILWKVRIDVVSIHAVGASSQQYDVVIAVRCFIIICELFTFYTCTSLVHIGPVVVAYSSLLSCGYCIIQLQQN